MARKILLSTIIAAAILLLPGNFIKESDALSRFCKEDGLPSAHPCGQLCSHLYGEMAAFVPEVTVSQRQLRPGTADETTLHIIEGQGDGPAVFVIGGIHGDETAGAMAAARVATWAIDGGTLFVLPQANPRALSAGSRCAPGSGDLNRVFPGAAQGTSCQQLAAAIYGIMEHYRPQWVVDLHEAQDFEETHPGALGQTIIYSRNAPSVETVAAAMEAANRATAPFQSPFLLLRGAVGGGTMHAAVNILGLDGFLVETCRKKPLEQRVQEHTRVVAALLEQLGMTVY